jgi:hypothetical protein
MSVRHLGIGEKVSLVLFCFDFSLPLFVFVLSLNYMPFSDPSISLEFTHVLDVGSLWFFPVPQ